jgi:hypothetical protein
MWVDLKLLTVNRWVAGRVRPGEPIKIKGLTQEIRAWLLAFVQLGLRWGFRAALIRESTLRGEQSTSTRFADLPAPARWGLVAGGSLLSTFSSKFPDALQSVGFYSGVVIGASGLLATVWHYLLKMRRSLGAPQVIILIAVGTAWLGITVALGAAAWALWNGNLSAPTSASSPAPKDEGPLSWIDNLWLNGGMGGQNVFNISFKGANISKHAVQIKSAEIQSGVTGTRLPLDIVAAVGQDNETVKLDQIEPIPPGARIELVARFNPPEGLPPKDFLETWRQFSVNIIDDSRSYNFGFNENVMMVFFEGKVGPRVTKRPDAPPAAPGR